MRYLRLPPTLPGRVANRQALQRDLLSLSSLKNRVYEISAGWVKVRNSNRFFC